MKDEERDELERDMQEDLELDEKDADGVRGSKAKSADKAAKAVSDYLKG